ncbi:MAG: nucleoside deaminase [Bacteroidales bacterium]|nr:nucleoside deaminase [Bacteroidales bacterium]MCF8387333.1 nucleoside deaminase [Bacteroidales bacterium]MCF8398035.1 nucleoside deaminase [Bacteroidales bacterium]
MEREIKDKEAFMLRAIDLAMENVHENHGGPFGAVVVKDGQIIAEGKNTVVKENDPTAHAEINAIRKACKVLNSHQLSDCELYASCEPCPMCLGAIYWARPKAVYFAADRKDAARAYFDDAHIYSECNTEIHKRRIPFKQMHRNKAIGVFLRWMENEQKTPY